MAEQVALATLVEGFRRSYDRWMAGPRVATSPSESFIAIFEILNWAVVADDRLKRILGRAWAKRFGEQDVIAAFRYARNAVHHDWSDALYVTPGAMLPTPVPFGLFEWRWRRTLPATRASGETQYAKCLAEQPVRLTLDTLNSLYVAALESTTTD